MRTVYVVTSTGNQFWPKKGSIVAVFSSHKDASDFSREVSQRVRGGTYLNSTDSKMFQIEEHVVDGMLGLVSWEGNGENAS